MKINTEQLKGLNRVLNGPCCYPDSVKKRKGCFIRLWENIKWWVINGRVNEDYNLYGLDLIGADQSMFLSHRKRVGDMMEVRSKYKINNLVNILENKYLFAEFCRENSIPHPRVFEYYGNRIRKILNNGLEEKLAQRQRIFIKQIAGHGGFEVVCITDKDGLAVIREQWKNKEYIIQQGVSNVEALASLNNHSLNTIRCVTISDGQEIKVLASVLRVGTRASGSVDNVSSGGIVIGINEHGRLLKWGNYDNEEKIKTTVHPDSHIEFLGYQIPNFQEAINLAIRAHKSMKEVPSVGWDLAVTKQGVVLIEGNYDWGLQIMQMSCGGLKHEWEDFMKIWKRVKELA